MNHSTRRPENKANTMKTHDDDDGGRSSLSFPDSGSERDDDFPIDQRHAHEPSRTDGAALQVSRPDAELLSLTRQQTYTEVEESDRNDQHDEQDDDLQSSLRRDIGFVIDDDSKSHWNLGRGPEYQSKEAEFHRQLALGPAYFFQHNNKRKKKNAFDTHYYFVCSCPNCVTEGLAGAKTAACPRIVRLKNGTTKTYTVFSGVAGEQYSVYKHVVLDDRGFLSPNHVLPTDYYKQIYGLQQHLITVAKVYPHFKLPKAALTQSKMGLITAGDLARVVAAELDVKKTKKAVKSKSGSLTTAPLSDIANITGRLARKEAPLSDNASRPSQQARDSTTTAVSVHQSTVDQSGNQK